MAPLFRFRARLLGRALCGLLLAASCLLAVPAPGLPAWLDGVVAEVDGAVITASDVALARALSLFDLQPSAEPIRSGDIARNVDAWLLVREAARLRLEITPDEEAAAWRAVAWDLRRRRFVEVRFRAFAFVSEDQVSEALGRGDHGGAARDRLRAALVQSAVDRELSAWLQELRSRSRIWRQSIPPEGIPAPFS